MYLFQKQMHLQELFQVATIIQKVMNYNFTEISLFLAFALRVYDQGMMIA